MAEPTDDHEAELMLEIELLRTAMRMVAKRIRVAARGASEQPIWYRQKLGLYANCLDAIANYTEASDA